MAKFFIDRPIFAIVLSVIITLVGIIAAVNLPIAQYPQIAPPTVSVSATYQGANADIVDQTVAQAIEQQVNGVENLVSMSSSSTDTGTYNLRVQFESGTNSDIASVQTQNRVAVANAALPASVQQSGVTTKKASNDMAMVFNLYSEDDRYDQAFLKNYGTIYLEDTLKRIKGVGDVTEWGADYSLRIWLQPDKMANLGISATQVTTAITGQNEEAPAGSFGQLPADNGQQFQYTTRVRGRLTDSKEFEDIIIAAKSDGSAIRLKDVARIEMGSKSYSTASKVNGHVSSAFAIQLTSDANSLDTIGKAQTALAEAAKSFPPGLKYTTVVDNTKFVWESIVEVVITFIEAILLVLVVVFVFLQSWRATLIPMLAVPVSLIGTFGAFVILGFTINTLTLFAMVLAIGLVVDDAIVVIESVEHHMRYSGLTPLEATKRAMDEVSGPVVAIAFVLASVFIPVAFFGGMMGILYKQFALTIAVSMALSAIIALSLTPALCAVMLKPHDPNAHAGRLGQFFDKFNNWFENRIESYGQGLGTLIAKSRLCMLFLLVVVGLLGVLYVKVPSAFVPQEDQGYFIAAVNLPEAASLNRTQDVMVELSDKIKKIPGVQNIMSVAGMDLLAGGSKSSGGILFVSLDSWAQRETPDKSSSAIIGKTFGIGAQIPEAKVIAFSPSALPGLGSVGGVTMVLEDKGGSSAEEVDSISQKFVAAAQKRPEIASITSNFKANTPGYQFEVDREKAQMLGVSVSDVFTTLQVFLGGSEVNDFNKFGRTYKVMVQSESPFRSDIDATRYLFVKNSSGTMVPLNTLIKEKKINSPTILSRFNASRSVQINANAAAGYSSGQVMTALEEVAAQNLPNTYGYEWSGQSREEKLSGGRAPIVFGMALVFVFLCLAALYESWSVPFAVLLAVPTGLFGAFLFQYLKNLENSVYMQIGLVMLIGLAAKNAILIGSSLACVGKN